MGQPHAPSLPTPPTTHIGAVSSSYLVVYMYKVCSNQAQLACMAPNVYPYTYMHTSSHIYKSRYHRTRDYSPCSANLATPNSPMIKVSTSYYNRIYLGICIFDLAFVVGPRGPAIESCLYLCRDRLPIGPQLYSSHCANTVGSLSVCKQGGYLGG